MLVLRVEQPGDFCAARHQADGGLVSGREVCGSGAGQDAQKVADLVALVVRWLAHLGVRQERV